MNEVIINNVVYKLESHWRCSKRDKSVDMRGNLFPYPKHKQLWENYENFVDKLMLIQDTIDSINTKNNFTEKELTNSDSECNDCLLCDKKNIVTKRYILKNKYVWDDGLIHYITTHGIRPSDEFIRVVYDYKIPLLSRIPVYLKAKIKEVNKIKNITLERNQLLILDALMIHGGRKRKYKDTESKEYRYRYSEHSGLLDFNENTLEKVIVSGNLTRVDQDDQEIYLPNDLPEISEYEYVFHTHPPTPKAGGRAGAGIIYEFPSMGDIFHFIEHFNRGKIIGSLIMTPEGLYIIRKINFDKESIDIDEDMFYDEIGKALRNAQDSAVEKYGSKIRVSQFYSEIAQDRIFIEKINDKLYKYGLIIEYHNREMDENGDWVVNSVNLQVFDK